jgi:hypothetical protein
MIFKRLNCTFGGIDTVVVRLDELHRTVLGLHECFDGSGGLVVCDVEDGFVTFSG